MNHPMRRVSYVFLCLVPFLAIPLAAVRALRIPGVYQAIGGLLFAAIVISAWPLGLRAIKTGPALSQQQAVAGALLLVPFTLVSLLWVGLAPPWEAPPTENRMRYLVLLVSSIAVAGGFVVLKGVVHEAGERLYSTLGFAANMLAGAAYLIWTSFALGAYVVKLRTGQTPPAVNAMGDVYEILLFIACVLTYLTTAAFAASLGRARWLSRVAARAYVMANFIAFLFIVLRGLSFPDPTTSAEPWYMSPGFIAGIPAVPWIMPFLLGVVLLRRAGDEPVD
jgi:hypothetical protein